MKTNRQKIVVEQGRAMSHPEVPHKVIDTMFVNSEDEAKEKVKELYNKYNDLDAISISYFSI